MPSLEALLLLAAIAGVAFLYSSVGHAGASGYIAVMSLFSLPAELIRPTALVLNLFVATIAFCQYWRAGHFSWRVFWPFAVLSIPLAYLGGRHQLPIHWFQLLVGVVLLASAFYLILQPRESGETRTPGRPVSMGVGGGLGLLAGLTGTGGGIFLSPLLILMRWATAKRTAATSALFIWVNSASGLAGNLTATRSLEGISFPLILAALAGGALGSHLGSRRFNPVRIKRLLAVVLVIAGGKLLLA